MGRLVYWLDNRFNNLRPKDCGKIRCQEHARKALDRVMQRIRSPPNGRHPVVNTRSRVKQFASPTTLRLGGGSVC